MDVVNVSIKYLHKCDSSFYSLECNLTIFNKILSSKKLRSVSFQRAPFIFLISSQGFKCIMALALIHKAICNKINISLIYPFVLLTIYLNKSNLILQRRFETYWLESF